MDLIHYTILFLFAFVAGFVDSVVGGGGLIQLPALLIFSPGVPVLTLMGSNKLAAFSGTAVSTAHYAKRTEIQWKSVLPAVFSAIIFSFLGARIIGTINKDYLKIILLILLISIAILTFLKKDLGNSHNPKLTTFKTIVYSLLTGVVIGFYDGFFGPGAGSFLIIIFITLFGFNFLISSASAKLVNCATGISALGYFIYTGQILYSLAVPIALFNIAGSFIGTKIAIKKGSAFVRILFMIIVGLMIIKFGTDVFKSVL